MQRCFGKQKKSGKHKKTENRKETDKYGVVLEIRKCRKKTEKSKKVKTDGLMQLCFAKQKKPGKQKKTENRKCWVKTEKKSKK